MGSEQKEVIRPLTQHKSFVPYSTHPNFCFAKTSFMLETLYEIRKPAFHGKETVNYDDVVAFV
jgi:hypothetical protein